jgi:DNA replication licensing factor MCM3
VGSIDATYAKETEDFFVGFEGSFGSKHVTPRTLTSRFLSNLVCLEGIVTSCSQVPVCTTFRKCQPMFADP